MNKPDITIPGFRGMDYSDAVECCEMDKRMLISATMKSYVDGQFFAEATLSTTGDTLILLIKNKRTGQHEVYDLKVRAHYFEDGEFPIPGAGKVVKAE